MWTMKSSCNTHSAVESGGSQTVHMRWGIARTVALATVRTASSRSFTPSAPILSERTRRAERGGGQQASHYAAAYAPCSFGSSFISRFTFAVAKLGALTCGVLACGNGAAPLMIAAGPVQLPQKQTCPPPPPVAGISPRSRVAQRSHAHAGGATRPRARAPFFTWRTRCIRLQVAWY
jgi:hypothetical protein